MGDAMQNSRRYLIAGASSAAILTVLGAGAVIAASFQSQSDIGTTSVATSCQSAAMSVDFTTTLDAATPTYQITDVVLGEIDAGCLGRHVQLRLTASNGNTVFAQGSGTINSLPTSSIVLDSAYQLPDNSWPITRVTLTVIS